jgi:hypothetical protein
MFPINDSTAGPYGPSFCNTMCVHEGNGLAVGKRILFKIVKSK